MTRGHPAAPARILLATGPVVGACWAGALILSHAWTWPVPADLRLALGSVLLLAVLAPAAAATSRRSYRRTRFAVAVGRSSSSWMPRPSRSPDRP